MALEADSHEIPDLAVDMGFEFLCGRGGGVSRCVIWEDGVAVIIPSRVRDGASLRVRSPSLDNDWLEIPVEVGVPVGVRHEKGLFMVQHLQDGEPIMNGGTYFPSSSSP